MAKLIPFYLNRQTKKRAIKLGYPVDVIGKKKPKQGIKISQTFGFVRYAFGNKNYLVAKRGYKLKYD